jgi:hypothetical protein
MYKNFVKKAILAIAISSTLATSAFGFDGKREGFIIGLGAGFHSTNFELYDDDISKSGFATSLKIGYGFSEDVTLYYIRNASWFKSSDDLYANGIMGIGSTYYFSPRAETFYLSGAIGLGDFTNIDESESESGFGLMLGAGYELRKHIKLEANMIMSTIDLDYQDKDLKPTSFQLTINYLWY